MASLEVDPETKRIIAEKIERANIELAELKESQTEVRANDIGSVGLNNNSEDEDDPAADGDYDHLEDEEVVGKETDMEMEEAEKIEVGEKEDNNEDNEEEEALKL